MESKYVAMPGLRSLKFLVLATSLSLGFGDLFAQNSDGQAKQKAGSSADAPLLRYRWEQNRDYHYQLSVNAKLEEVEYKYHGLCNLRVEPHKPSVTEKANSTVTGTAFVVAADGYLVTASHVVEGATSLKITLNNNTYEGKVVSSDVLKDLALIKVEAEQLKPLPFGDSDQVGLGQSIWALGYPLSDLLGPGLKINSGMVSGINQPMGGKVFQLNATLNAGNSGGPILNENGHVIAVAIQRLAGRDISDVGLTRPINDTRDLIVAQGITLPKAIKQKRKLDGQAIVNMSQESVAFVEVEINPLRDATKLAYLGSITTERTNSRSGREAAFRSSYSTSSPKHRTPKGAFLVSPFGDLSEMNDDDEIPFALGHIAEFLFEPFDSAGRSEWTQERKSTIAVMDSEPKSSSFEPSSPIRPPLSFFDPPSRNEKQKLKLYDVIESERFKIKKREGNQTYVEKNVELKTTDDSKRPYLDLSGQGEWVFNHQEGYLELTTAKYDFVLQATANVSIRIPIEVKINYIDRETVAANAKKAQEQQAIYEAKANQKKALDYEQMPAGVKVKRLQRFNLGKSQVQAMCLSKDGAYLAVALIDGKISLFSRNKTEPIKELKGNNGSSKMIEFSPDSQFLIAGSYAEARAWNIQTEETFSLSQNLASYSQTSVFSPDSRYVYLIKSYDGIERFELKTGISNQVFKDDSHMEAITLSKDGKTLILTDHRKEIVHWNLESNQLTKKVSLNQNGAQRNSYNFAVLSPSGIGLFGRYDSLDVLKLEDASTVISLPGKRFTDEGIALSKDGRIAAISMSSDKTALIWDVANNKRIEEVTVDTVSAKLVALSPEGKYVATVGYDNVVQLWENTSQ
jgi:S1-C subfamily serine protease/WD40 repeat protein